MAQTLRALVELEVPDTVDLDQLKEKLQELFPGKVRCPQDEDLVIFFRPEVEYGEVTWGLVAPEAVTMYCNKTANQLLLGVEKGDLYYHHLGEVLTVAERLLLKAAEG